MRTAAVRLHDLPLAAMIADDEAGMTYLQVAAKYGVQVMTAYHRLRMAGVKSRLRGAGNSAARSKPGSISERRRAMLADRAAG
jgi:hypothetical protein